MTSVKNHALKYKFSEGDILSSSKQGLMRSVMCYINLRWYSLRTTDWRRLKAGNQRRIWNSAARTNGSQARSCMRHRRKGTSWNSSRNKLAEPLMPETFYWRLMQRDEGVSHRDIGEEEPRVKEGSWRSRNSRRMFYLLWHPCSLSLDRFEATRETTWRADEKTHQNLPRI